MRVTRFVFVPLLIFGCFISFLTSNSLYASRNVGVRLLSQYEMSQVKGGLGSKGGGSSSSSTPVYDSVTLNNVPYYNQTDGIKDNWRSRYYCGLTSLFMVRHKGEDYFNPSPYKVSQSEVDLHMKTIDDALYNHPWYYTFPSVFDTDQNLNIVGSATEWRPSYDGGLLYIDSSMTDSQQFDKTVKILSNLYKNNFKRMKVETPGLNQTSVNSISIEVLRKDEALDKIWSYIRDNHEPVVVVMDSGCTDDLKNQRYVSGMTSNPVLHYNVIVGIKEDSAGKYFIVNDPWDSKWDNHPGEHRTYKAEHYINSLCVTSRVTPSWVYDYAYWTNYGSSCYAMFINK